MITLKDFMEAVDYRITEGSEFCWDCFGPNAYRLDSWNGEQDGHTVSVTFDTITQIVYQVEAFDYANNRAYRWSHPDYKKAYEDEAKTRNVDPYEAWGDDPDTVKFVELDVEADFLEKARAIIAGEQYDTRVQIEIDIDDDLLYNLMKLAHERDITLNQLVEQILSAHIEQLKKEEK